MSTYCQYPLVKGIGAIMHVHLLNGICNGIKLTCIFISHMHAKYHRGKLRHNYLQPDMDIEPKDGSRIQQALDKA